MNITEAYLLANGVSSATLATAKGAVAHTAVKTETPKPSKYRAVRTEYAGVWYDSKAEAAYAKKLDGMVSAGLIRWWTPKPGTFRLGLPECKYRPDFLVAGIDGTYVVDVKGVETPKWKRDRTLWAAYGPCPLWVVTKGGIEVITPKGTTIVIEDVDTTGDES